MKFFARQVFINLCDKTVKMNSSDESSNSSEGKLVIRSSDESSNSSEAKLGIEIVLPPKSKDKYELIYKKFQQWKIDNISQSLSENVFLAYFNDLSAKMKPSSLWNTYSILKSTVLINDNVNIKDYHNLTNLLKRQSDGYKCRKSRILSKEDVEKFINEAPDSEYLAMKVVLIFGIYGACRCAEITHIMVNDIKTENDVMTITLRDTKTKTDRTFSVRDTPLALVHKYRALRPFEAKTSRFFLNYRKSKCTKQVMGTHNIAQIPKLVAMYLNLPNPEQYTGHCFRRSSATMLADTGVNLLTLKLHGGWKTSRAARGYIDASVQNKSNMTNQISKCLNLNATTSHQEASTSGLVKTKFEFSD